MKSETKIFLKQIIPFFLVLMIFVVPVLSLAQDAGGDGRDAGGAGRANDVNIKFDIVNPFNKKVGSIQDLIKTIVNDILMPIGAVVSVVMIMWAGFLYVTARGDPGQIKKAHDALLWAAIGAAILLGAWVISQVIGNTIDQLKS